MAKAPSKNVAGPKSKARKRVVKKKKPVSKVDFNELQQQKNPDVRSEYIRKSIETQSPSAVDPVADYLCLSDMFQNFRRGGQAVLARFHQQIKKEAERGLGVRTWQLKMIQHPDGSKPKPGDTISWIRQRHNRLDYGTGDKIGTTQAQEMIRRGDGHLLTEEAEVVLDKDCCFDCTYGDAVDLLSKYGVYYLTFDEDGPRDQDMPISKMYRVDRSGTHNWRFVEMPPGFFAKKRAPKELPPDTPPIEVN